MRTARTPRIAPRAPRVRFPPWPCARCTRAAHRTHVLCTWPMVYPQGHVHLYKLPGPAPPPTSTRRGLASPLEQWGNVFVAWIIPLRPSGNIIPPHITGASRLAPCPTNPLEIEGRWGNRRTNSVGHMCALRQYPFSPEQVAGPCAPPSPNPQVEGHHPRASEIVKG